jgi:DNA-directed RNA polymerase
MTNLYDAQLELERIMKIEAKQRLDRDNEKTTKRNEWSTSRIGTIYVKKSAKTMYESVSEFMNLGKRQGPGRHHIAAKMLNEAGLEANTVSYLVAKAIFNSVLVMSKTKKSIKRNTLCTRIGDILHDEWRVRFFADSDKRKGLLKKLMKDFDKRSYPRHWRKKTILGYFHSEQLEWQGWTKRQRVHLGYAMLCIYMRETAQVEVIGTDVYPTEELVKHIQDMCLARADIMMLYKPMVSPPKPWTDCHLFRGGYLSNEVKRYPIVKGAGRRDVARFVEMDWSRILPAVNRLQETPWRVNRDMLEVLDWTYNQYGLGVPKAKLVRCDHEPLPEIPYNYYDDEDVKKEHNHRCFLIHDRNRQNKSPRIAAIMTLSLAKQFAQYDAIYFPHNLDTRGRAYPLPAFLNPQGPDYCKALLEFSNGHPIDTPEELNWLAICIANAYGNDKVSLEDRVKWVHDNEDLILSTAQDYRTDRRWMDVSEPFQFLRGCLEWAGFKGEGWGFVSHMVIPVDATCSGLQHYAAMLRDEIGGKSVNLIPGYSRQDIYGDVAKVALAKMAEEGSDLSKDWIAFGVDRKMTKRQVMVVPYAGKFSSCLGYTRAAFEEKLAEGHVAPWDVRDHEINNAHMGHLAKFIWEAISEVVVKGKEAMQWLSKCASEYAKVMNNKETPDVYSKRMTWTTPDGFEVAHFREDEREARVQTQLDGKVSLVMYEGTGKLSSKDMGLAVAPNFVHSLDAAHLRMTIMRGLEAGITDFGMIHDSFGVHAKHMATFLRDAVKPAFIDLYSTDVIAGLAEALQGLIKVPPVPTKGGLDLAAVQESEFFFS